MAKIIHHLNEKEQGTVVLDGNQMTSEEVNEQLQNLKGNQRIIEKDDGSLHTVERMRG